MNWKERFGVQVRNLCHFDPERVNSLNGIGCRGVDFTRVPSGSISPDGAGNKTQEHVLMLVRLDGKN